MTLITTTAELTLACQRFARHSFVTVDTEFLRETTFWPILCVVQVASERRGAGDRRAGAGLDLTPLFALMADPNVVKVFHAARQDVEIFWKLAGLVPAPMFDTQVAAMVCGYGDQVSYSELVHSICRVAIDKSSRFTDWARRPLAAAQIDYAIGDVTYLRDIYRALLAQAREIRPQVLARGRDEGPHLAPRPTSSIPSAPGSGSRTAPESRAISPC